MELNRPLPAPAEIMLLPAGIWDEQHLKALLRLPRYPLRLIQQEPWQSWIECRGGVKAVLDHLSRCTLPQNQSDLLGMILAYPEASVQFYSDKLHISPRTYANHLSDLILMLLSCLNAWTLDAQQDATSARQGINLPAPLTSLIGAEKAVAEATDLMRRPDVRLLTITGPGGVGKTRLAIQLAAELIHDFPDGVCFVPLASVNNPSLVTAEIARTLRLGKTYDQLLLDVLKVYLWGRQFLVILDNFEHLVTAAPVVTELLQVTPGLKVIVTSREILNLYGEYSFTVQPLALPDLQHLPPFEQLEECAAIRLFVERARAFLPGFALDKENAAVIAEICHHLDGLPLAIELAAARIKLFSPAQMLDEMKHRLQFLDRGPRDLPARHRTLRNTIEWSYRLLSNDERVLFRRLGVFEDSWSIDAAEALYGGTDIRTLLQALVDKSLIQLSPGIGEPRFHMLQTIREYALEQLEIYGESTAVHRQHALYYIELAEAAERELASPRQDAWLLRIKTEHDNLRAALKWTVHTGELDLAFRLAAALSPYWNLFALSEAWHWLEVVLDAGRHHRTSARGRVLWGVGWLASVQGKHELAKERFEEGFILAQELGDEHLMGLTRQGLADLLHGRNEFEQAKQMFEENLALFRKLQDQNEIAWTLDHLGRVALDQSDYLRARTLLEESLAIFTELGHGWGVTMVLDHLGRVALALGDYAQAQALFEESLIRSQTKLSEWGRAWTFEVLAAALLAQGRLEQTQRILEECLNLWAEIKHPVALLFILEGYAALSAASGDYIRAAQLGGMIQTWTDSGGSSLPLLNRLRFQKTLATARLHLDEDTFTMAWSAGQAMSLDEALAFASEVRL